MPYNEVLEGSSSSLQVGFKGAPAPLGIHAGIASPLVPVSPRSVALNRRFALLNTARDLLPDMRIRQCMRVPVDRAAGVELLFNSAHNRAHFGHLQTCASPHVCPVCAPTLAVRRGEEISRAVSIWTDRGGSCVMATFTLQHDTSDSLQDVAGAMKASYRAMKSGKAWKGFQGASSIAGSIAATEYTIGGFGWHPHFHTLFFLPATSPRRARLFERSLFDFWSASLARNGRYASATYGVDCRLADDPAIAEYVTKSGNSWTVADELTKANTKTARWGGRSIVALLVDASEGDEAAAWLFREYAAFTFRKNQLVWSRGLRKLLGLVDELSDDELLAEQVKGSQLVVQLTRHQWYVILANDARADVLLVVEADAGGIVQLVNFLGVLGISLEPWQFSITE